MSFAAVIDLGALDGATGFKLSGTANGDNSGLVVASAGDINGDGIDDLIVAAANSDVGGYNSGAVYVVFGRAGEGGFPGNINLEDLDGTTGFRINGTAEAAATGISLGSAGDVNGDGVNDLIIGSRTGSAYVVFGRAASDGAFAADLELSALDGANGFRIDGAQQYDGTGLVVAGAGDLNGDGIGDLVLSAKYASSHGYSTGLSYVVFGRDAAVVGDFAASVSLATLGGDDGFRIAGVAAYDLAGAALAPAGDVNGDGIDDLLIGAHGADLNGSQSGASYVVFGRNTAVDGAFAGTVELSDLDGGNGFRIVGAAPGDQSGYTLASAGDVNGDGITDIIVGARYADPHGSASGAAYVVFGRDTETAGAFAASLDLAALDGTNGFRISGVAANDFTGWSVSSAGDIDGDGVDDLIIGARSADSGGLSNNGASFVVFGRDTAAVGAFAANLDLSTLNGTNGFRVNGAAAGDISGGWVSAAGDVNGDGVDDLIIGARSNDPNGVPNAGASYVIFGQVEPVSFVGTGADETRTGRAGKDSLSGLAGKDTLSGLGGDDLLDGGDGNDVLLGGDGADGLIGGSGGDILYGDAGDDSLDGGLGADKLFGGLGADGLQGGDGNDRLDGGGGFDILAGGDGNDYLDGGIGPDLMIGGLGNDVYIVDDMDDAPDEGGGGGYDIVRTSVDGWRLFDGLEALEQQGSADIDGLGNSGANNLQGNSGSNTLSGLAGVDTINGNDGDDFIVGGSGNDLLRGGLGADTFVVAHAFGAILETDQIYDFSAAEGDILDLSGAFDGAIALVSGFTKAAGQMTLTFAGGITTLRLDTTGDGKADYQMKINGDVTGESGDWLL